MTREADQSKVTTKTKPVGKKATRKQQLSKLLLRKSGASIAQIQKAFDWKPHTARAAISTLRKSGATIERIDSAQGSSYRMTSER